MKNDKLMALATVAAFGLLYVMAFQKIPPENKEVFIFLLGLVCGFFFGGAIKQATPPGTVSTTSTPLDASLTAGSSTTQTVTSGGTKSETVTTVPAGTITTGAPIEDAQKGNNDEKTLITPDSTS